MNHDLPKLETRITRHERSRAHSPSNGPVLVSKSLARGGAGGRNRQMTDNKIKSSKKLLASNFGVSVPVLVQGGSSLQIFSVLYRPFSDEPSIYIS